MVACPATSRLIPMIGSAPDASIFPVKVFPAAGGGSPRSRTIQAMEAVIDLRQQFEAGEPGGFNIQVANLSLGGPTNAAARTISDQAVEASSCGIQSSTVHTNATAPRCSWRRAWSDSSPSIVPKPACGASRPPRLDHAGTVSYTVDIWSSNEAFPAHTAKDKIETGDAHIYKIEVPAGTTALETRLEWMNMNGNYPISDIDVILAPPSGPVVNSCNTLRTPELCVVSNPVAGTWTATVVGFSIPEFGRLSGREHDTLRIEADGEVLTLKKKSQSMRRGGPPRPASSRSARRLSRSPEV